MQLSVGHPSEARPISKEGFGIVFRTQHQDKIPVTSKQTFKNLFELNQGLLYFLRLNGEELSI